MGPIHFPILQIALPVETSISSPDVYSTDCIPDDGQLFPGHSTAAISEW